MSLYVIVSLIVSVPVVAFIFCSLEVIKSKSINKKEIRNINKERAELNRKLNALLEKRKRRNLPKKKH